jgi:hypothetical protein
VRSGYRPAWRCSRRRRTSSSSDAGNSRGCGSQGVPIRDEGSPSATRRPATQQPPPAPSPASAFTQGRRRDARARHRPRPPHITSPPRSSPKKLTWSSRWAARGMPLHPRQALHRLGPPNPAGLPLDQVRAIRDDIARSVHELVLELDQWGRHPWGRWVPVGCLKPRELPVKAVESPDPAHTREPRVCREYARRTGNTRSACHAEGRGFESLQPLRRRPAFAGLFRGRSRLVRLRRRAPNRHPAAKRGGCASEQARLQAFPMTRTIDLLFMRRMSKVRCRVRSHQRQQATGSPGASSAALRYANARSVQQLPKMCTWPRSNSVCGIPPTTVTRSTL